MILILWNNQVLKEFLLEDAYGYVQNFLFLLLLEEFYLKSIGILLNIKLMKFLTLFWFGYIYSLCFLVVVF